MRFGKRAQSGAGTYNFTDRVRQCLARARQEAAAHGHGQVGPEHLLLGLLADQGSLAIDLLRELGIVPDAVRTGLVPRLPAGSGSVQLGGQEYTGGGKRVLEKAMNAARELRHSYVGTEHILLGIIAGGDPLAAATLLQLGATYEGAKTALGRLGERVPGAFRVSLDDASELSIYEQIVAQVKEAVATGRLAPGERMATVRQLADDLDIAPGTVARAYAELERLGVVRTDGARGTRVADRQPSASSAVDPATLEGLLRPVAVAAFHMGAGAAQLRAALEEAMRGILTEPPSA